MLALNHSCFSQNDFPATSDLEVPRHWLDRTQHVVDDDSLLLWSVVVKTGRPPLESLEAEGEGVLSRREAGALEDHGFLPGKHVPGLEVAHLKISVGGSANVLWSEIVIGILFRLAVRDVQVLNFNNQTSELTS